jgi:ferrochelatase
MNDTSGRAGMFDAKTTTGAASGAARPVQGTAPAGANPHLPGDHPIVPPDRIGVLIANLGTPDHYSYWPMRRYLNEFLSDRRVIDYSPLIWQPLLQLVILSKRPFSSGANYRLIWNEELNESPLMTITKAQTAKIG